MNMQRLIEYLVEENVTVHIQVSAGSDSEGGISIDKDSTADALGVENTEQLTSSGSEENGSEEENEDDEPETHAEPEKEDEFDEVFGEEEEEEEEVVDEPNEQERDEAGADFNEIFG